MQLLKELISKCIVSQQETVFLCNYHHFHSNCLIKWIIIGNQHCPLCRTICEVDLGRSKKRVVVVEYDSD